MNASLDEKLRSVKWGEYRLGDLFYVQNYKKKFDANKVTVLETGKHPYIVRMGGSNGQKGFLNEDEKYLNEGNTLSFGQDTATVFYQEKPYFTGDKIKILKCKNKKFGKQNAQFFVAAITKVFAMFSWGNSSYSIDTIEKQIVKLPTKNGDVDFDFMESFISELEAERVAEMEAERVAELSAYLKASGLDNYELSDEEEKAIDCYSTYNWKAFNLKALYGKSTRGKRLKGEDRIPGTLPFVTAGEAEEGISAFIGNKVEVFEKNTTTIDMFGSAKYRNYQYGGDDHVAIVHTENIPMKAAIFVTSACHKAAHTGKFHYGHNFYAKDADELNIMLPAKDGKPDYESMETLISAVQKLVIKDVVRYTNRRLDAAKKVVAK